MNEPYHNRLRFPWRVAPGISQGSWRVVDASGEVVCHIMTKNKLAAARIVEVCNADDDTRRRIGYDAWLWQAHEFGDPGDALPWRARIARFLRSRAWLTP
jgi:hypothetical protein